MSLHFDIVGPPDAPPVLLVMGLSLGSRAWDRLPSLLAPRFRVITFDNRGTGKSLRGGFRFTIPQLADDAANVLDLAGVERANVFGISMGGMIAQELALRHPERVRSLALGCTFACWKRSRRPALRALLDLSLLNLGFARTRERVGHLLGSREFEAKNPGRVAEWIRNGDRTTPRYVLAQMLAIVGHSCHARLSQITAPTLVLTGTADRLIPPENSEVLARLIPDARLVKLEGAGHVFPLEREQETVDALTRHFLQTSLPGHDARTG